MTELPAASRRHDGRQADEINDFPVLCYAALRCLTSATARPVFPFTATAGLVANTRFFDVVLGGRDDWPTPGLPGPSP